MPCSTYRVTLYIANSIVARGTASGCFNIKPALLYLLLDLRGTFFLKTTCDIRKRTCFQHIALQLHGILASKVTRTNILIYYLVPSRGPLFWYLILICLRCCMSYRSCGTNRVQHTDVVGGSRVEPSFIDCFLLMSQSIFLSLLPSMAFCVCVFNLAWAAPHSAVAS